MSGAQSQTLDEFNTASVPREMRETARLFPRFSRGFAYFTPLDTMNMRPE